jgi:FkbM family methyltransferase
MEQFLKQQILRVVQTNFFRLLARFVILPVCNRLKIYLNPYRQYVFNGHDRLLFEGHAFPPKQTGIILGGYQGVSATKWLKMYDLKLIIVEPIFDYFDQLKRKFANNPAVIILNLAAASKDGKRKIVVNGDRTSFFEINGDIQNVATIDVCSIIEMAQSTIAFLEVNIEGGEYEVLTRLIETGHISKIYRLFIQFHDVNADSSRNRELIEDSLTLTHTLVFNYPWVWQYWEKV